MLDLQVGFSPARRRNGSHWPQDASKPGLSSPGRQACAKLDFNASQLNLVKNPGHEQSAEVLHSAFMRLVIDFEKEATSRSRAEARVSELEQLTEWQALELDEWRSSAKKKVRFVDGGTPRGGARCSHDECDILGDDGVPESVPASLLTSAQSQVHGLQRKIEAYYDELGALESKLEIETMARLEAERTIAKLEAEKLVLETAPLGTPPKRNGKCQSSPKEASPARLVISPKSPHGASHKAPPHTCPVCYSALDFHDRPARLLPCCSAIACPNCLKDMLEDDHLCCGECFTLHAVHDFDTFLARLSFAAPFRPPPHVAAAKRDCTTQTAPLEVAKMPTYRLLAAAVAFFQTSLSRVFAFVRWRRR